jgi:quercetin dioxygenase-like cupin family protein
MNNPTISPASDAKIVEADWGQLTWYAGAQLKNSEGLTVGKCVIKPGFSNPKHLHPNCEEVLVVLQGKISHTIGAGTEAVLNVGDTITIPQGFLHQARNIGNIDAVLYIAFSSANREVRGE